MHKKDAMEVCKRMTAILAVLVIFVIVPASSVLGEETASAERIFRSPRYHRGDTNIVKIQPIDDASWIWHPHDSGNIAVMIFEKLELNRLSLSPTTYMRTECSPTTKLVGISYVNMPLTLS